MYMENAAAQVIKAITNTPITISEEEEEINVCQAVDEMIEDGRAEGRAEGINIGEQNKAFEIARKLKQKGYTIVEITELTGLSPDDIASA